MAGRVKQTRTKTMIKFTGKTGLPRTTASLCPECGKVIKAVLKEKEGKVLMEKTCPDHGFFWDLISSSVDIYLRMEDYAHDGVGLENPYFTESARCPVTCGMCTLHKSHTSLALMDLTNRCNLKCPVCFANANAAGYIYEPSTEQLQFMMQSLRDQKPVPTVAIQFSGGEPTLSPHFLWAANKAHEMGFTQIQVATNGIRLANDPDFASQCVEHHLHTVYLQFDGLDDEIYKRVRGVPMLDIKKRAIENARNARSPSWAPEGSPRRPLSVMLVPTLVGGFNDHQVAPILEFAIDNLDTVRGINYQPVALTARIPDEDRHAMRYTQSDLVIELTNSGYFEKTDFFPVPSVAPISQLVSIIHGTPKLTMTAHPGCGVATFAFVRDRKVVPLARFMDINGFFESVEDLIEKFEDARFQRLRTTMSAAKMRSQMAKFFDFDHAPEGMTEKNVLRLVTNLFTEGNKAALSDFTWNTLYVGSMHFQDSYNYDIERLKRCVIHYTSPDGRIIPFCSYNSGPIYREEVEQKFSVPIAEWKENKRAAKTVTRLEVMGTEGEVITDAQAYIEASKSVQI